MKLSRRKPLQFETVPRSIFRTLGFFGSFALLVTANAQEVLSPLSKASPPPSASQSEGNAGGDAGTSPAVAAMAAGGIFSAGVPIGPFTLHPHMVYRFLYGDGIQAVPGKPTTTAINSLAPGLLADLGTHWTVDYTPTWNYYSNSAFRDSIDHSARLDGETTYQDWILAFSQTFVITNQPLVETGRQTREEDYVTRFKVDYQLGSQIMLESALNQNVRLASGFNDTRDWSAEEWVHLSLSPRLNTAMGGDFGYTAVSKAPDMWYFRPQGRVLWHPGTLVSVQVSAGIEHRELYKKGSYARNSPIVGASLQYRPFKSTGLSLSTDRATAVSYFSSEVVETTHLALGLDQQFFGVYNFTAGFNYQEATYRATGEQGLVARKDDNVSFRTSLQTIFRRRLTVACTFQTSHNSSNASGFAFSSNQLGLEMAYRY